MIDIKTISAGAGLLVLLGTGINATHTWLTQTVATKDYHAEDLDSVRTSLAKIETNSLVPRMINALNARCEAIQTGSDLTFVEEIIDRMDKDYCGWKGVSFRVVRAGMVSGFGNRIIQSRKEPRHKLSVSL